MSTVLIGIDLAKSVFQFHGLDAQGKVTLRKHVNRKDFLPFFERTPQAAMWRWRLAARPIIGGGGYRRWDIE